MRFGEEDRRQDSANEPALNLHAPTACHIASTSRDHLSLPTSSLHAAIHATHTTTLFVYIRVSLLSSESHLTADAPSWTFSLLPCQRHCFTSQRTTLHQTPRNITRSLLGMCTGALRCFWSLRFGYVLSSMLVSLTLCSTGAYRRCSHGSREHSG